MCYTYDPYGCRFADFYGATHREEVQRSERDPFSPGYDGSLQERELEAELDRGEVE